MRVGAQRLGLDDAQPAVGVLVDDPLVLDQAGAVDDAVNAAVTGVDRGDQRCDRRRIAHVNDPIHDLRAGRAECRDVGADLAVTQDSLHVLFDVARPRRLA